jgi:hypothetical protein
VATVAQLEPSGRWDADGIALEAKKDGGRYRSPARSSSFPTATRPTC